MGTILNHKQAMLFRNGVNAIHIGGIAAIMDRNNACSTGRNRRFNGVRINLIIFWLYIHNNRDSIDKNNSCGCSDECAGGANDFIPRLYANRFQC